MAWYILTSMCGYVAASAIGNKFLMAVLTPATSKCSRIGIMPGRVLISISSS